MFGISDTFKNVLIWGLIGFSTLAFARSCADRSSAAVARADLASEKASRAEERSELNHAALRATEQKLEAQAEHAKTQQEITYVLSQAQQDAARLAVDLRARDERVRVTQLELSSARSKLRAGADAIVCAPGSDRVGGLLDLLEEGAGLAAEAGGLAAEGARLVRLRDAEVKSLKALVQADRAALKAPSK